jgi:1-deoxypentalenic acid 11beta-hydroxylase
MAGFTGELAQEPTLAFYIVAVRNPSGMRCPMSNSQTLATFTDSTASLDNPAELAAAFDRDGYLFFRGMLTGIDEVRREFIRILQRQGAVSLSSAEPVWAGLPADRIDDTALYLAPSVAQLFESPHNLQVFERACGEPVFVFRSPTVRYALPHDAGRVSPPHQDAFFVRINASFRTFWIPLMDIDEQVGGLAISPASHRRGLRDHTEIDNVYSYVFQGRRQKGIPLDAVPQPWATADYRAGDLLVFHPLMIHWALPNRSDRIRLSIDNRACPVNAPRTWQSERSIPEARAFRRTAQHIASEERILEHIFESIMIELMGRGLEPTRANILALRDELVEAETRQTAATEMEA